MIACAICRRPRASAVGLCERCAKSYETTDGGDMWDVIHWAIKRTRYFDARTSKATLAFTEKEARLVDRLLDVYIDAQDENTVGAGVQRSNRLFAKREAKLARAARAKLGKR